MTCSGVSSLEPAAANIATALLPALRRLAFTSASRLLSRSLLCTWVLAADLRALVAVALGHVLGVQRDLERVRALHELMEDGSLHFFPGISGHPVEVVLPGEEELLHVRVSRVGEGHEILELEQSAIFFIDSVLVVDGPQELPSSQPLLPARGLCATYS